MITDAQIESLRAWAAMSTAPHRKDRLIAHHAMGRAAAEVLALIAEYERLRAEKAEAAQ